MPLLCSGGLCRTGTAESLAARPQSRNREEASYSPCIAIRVTPRVRALLSRMSLKKAQPPIVGLAPPPTALLLPRSGLVVCRACSIAWG